MNLNLYPLSLQYIVTTKVQMLCCVNCVCLRICACMHVCVHVYMCMRACMWYVFMCIYVCQCHSVCMIIMIIHSIHMYVTSYIYVHLYVQCLASRDSEHFLLIKLCCHTSPWCCTFKGRHLSKTASKHLRRICWWVKALFPCFGGSHLDLQPPFIVRIVSSVSNADGLNTCLF